MPALGVVGQLAALQWEAVVLLQRHVLGEPERHVPGFVLLREPAHGVQQKVFTLDAASAAAGLALLVIQGACLLHLARGVQAFSTRGESHAALQDVMDGDACGLGFLLQNGPRHPLVLRWRGTQPRTMSLKLFL